MSNFMQMLSIFPQFMEQMKGLNSDSVIDGLVKSGKFTQEQVEQARQEAQRMSGQFEQFRNMFGFNK